MPTTNAARNGSGKTPGIPQRQRSTTVGSSIPVSSADNAGRKKSLLPQPRTAPPRGPPLADLKKVQGRQLTGTTDPVKKQEQPPLQSNPVPEPPRPDPEDPEDAKDAKAPSNTTLPPRPRSERVVTRSKSPAKTQHNDTKSAAATKKTAMPPPVRPARSASLRQPSPPKLAGPADGKGHARHRSQVLSTARTTGTPALLPTPSRQPEKSSAKPPRPQFTTFQQHFSPKKEKEAPRTLAVAERRTGKSTESNVAATAARPEVAALQTELLQLCLLYSSSLQQDKEWKAAAENQLRGKYHSVAATYKTLSDEERHIQEQLNLKALHDWSVDSAAMAEHDIGNNFQSQIQSFSRVTQEVADLTAEAGGRYSSVIQAFEEWLARVESVRASRNTSTTDLDEPRYIDALGRTWRDEVDDLSIKAELCLRELTKMTIFTINEDEFCRKHSNSALVRIALQQREILALMVDELKAMRAIELEAVDLEKAWVAQEADRVAAGHRITHSGGGAWID
jgi:hypothetical protein